MNAKPICTIAVSMCLLTMFSSHTFAAKPADNLSDTYQACNKIVKKIERIEQRMRHGYSAAQGERLKMRLRFLKDQRNDCERYAENAKKQPQKNSYQGQNSTPP